MSKVGNLVLDIEEHVVEAINSNSDTTDELMKIAEQLRVPYQWVNDTYERLLGPSEPW